MFKIVSFWLTELAGNLERRESLDCILILHCNANVYSTSKSPDLTDENDRRNIIHDFVPVAFLKSAEP